MDFDLHEDIAVIGLACRAPGAADAEELWRNLCAGQDSITREYNPATGSLDRAGGCVDQLEYFDAGFFGIGPREAQLIDPQQRMFFECAWTALEQAGYASQAARQRIGVFGGMGISTYLLNNVWPSLGGGARAIVDSAEDMRVLIASDKDFLTGRTAYLLNLRGPSMTVQAACASGLYAVHLAAQALLAGECEMAVAGAANATVPQTGLPGQQDGTYVSRDGYTRTFDRSATGSVFGSGAGAVVLKVLADAIRDGDVVRAVVKGSAVNNDGAGKTGLTAPSGPAQQAVIELAMTIAGARPGDVGMIEAHGTATPVGDPIEVAALDRALCGAAPGSVLLTSIKPNIGHLGWAAGILGFIKAALCVERAAVPPALHFQSLNPQIDLDRSPLRISTQLEHWNSSGGQVAGVSSFGVSGFNAHVVLHAPPRPGVAAPSPEPAPPLVIAVSGTSRGSLAATAQRWADALDQQAAESTALADLSYTSLLRRTHLPVRRAVVGRDRDALARALRRCPMELAGRQAGAAPARIAMLFTGYTPDLAGRAGPLSAIPDFRAVLDAARGDMIEHAGQASIDLLLSEHGHEPAADLVPRQVAQFVLQVALVELWRSCGISPDVVCGHSLGEYAAAYAAGVLDLPSGIALVALRARLYERLPADTCMAAVGCGENLARRACADAGVAHVEIAAVNGPASVVVTGTRQAVEHVCATIRAEGYRARLLPYARAGHSRWVEPFLPELAKALSAARLQPPVQSFVSGVTGGLVSAELTSAAYWQQQMREPVRFAAAVRSIASQGVGAFVELGAAPVLSSLVQEVLPEFEGPVTGALLPDEPPWESLLRGLGELFENGADITWPSAVLAGGRATLAPTYAFDRKRYWIDSPASATAPPGPADDLAQLTVRPTWIPDQDLSEPGPLLPGRHYLVFPDSGTTATGLIEALASDGAMCTVAVAADDDRAWPAAFEVRRIRGQADVRAAVRQPAVPLSGVLVAATLDLPAPDARPWEPIEEGLLDLLVILAALAGATVPVPGLLLTRGAQPAGACGAGPLGAALGQAPVWAAARSASVEEPGLQVSCLDLDPDGSPESDIAALLDTLARPGEAERAWRDGRRWVHRLAPDDAAPTPQALDPAATYLVTGGLGTLGLLTAKALADRGARQLLLVGRRDPAPETRDALTDLASRARVEVRRVDVAVPEEVEKLLASVTERGSWIAGVVHAAGVIDDATLETLTLEQVRSVFAGKARGAWNLHAALGDDPRVQFLTFYSSVASVFGNAAQANYAAANGFLDALAAYRVALGRPGLAIAWGAWADVGVLAERPELVAALAARGLGALPMEPALRAIRDLVPASTGCVAVTRQDWRVWTDQLATCRVAYYERLLTQDTPADRPGADALDLPSMAPDERRAFVAQTVHEALEEVLGVDDLAARRDVPLADLGLDSLSAIGLRNRIRTRLGLTLPLGALVAGATSAALADTLLGLSEGQT